MLPEQTAVFRTQGVPAPRVGHEAGVESKDARLGDDLAASAASEGTHQMDDLRDLVNLQPVRHGRPADLAFAGDLVMSSMPPL